MADDNYELEDWEKPEDEDENPWNMLDSILDALPAFTSDDIRVRSRTITKLAKLKLFLKFFATGMTLIAAAKAAGYTDLTQVYKEQNTNPKFRDALQAAYIMRGDILEDIAFTRATVGWQEKTVRQGDNGTEITTKNRISERMLAMLLKGAKPDKYAERSQHDININAKVGIAIITAAPQQTAAEWEKDALAMHAGQKVLTLSPEKVIDVSVDKVQSSIPIKRE